MLPNGPTPPIPRPPEPPERPDFRDIFERMESRLEGMPPPPPPVDYGPYYTPPPPIPATIPDQGEGMWEWYQATQAEREAAYAAAEAPRYTPGQYTPATLYGPAPGRPGLQMGLTPPFLYDYPGAGMGPGRERAWEWRRVAEALQGRMREEGTTMALPPIALEAAPGDVPFSEQMRERWFGAWPEGAMRPGFREWVGREAGWTPEAREHFGPIPLGVTYGGPGGGGWFPPTQKPPRGAIGLGSGVSEGAIHEYAHSWYQRRMNDKPYRDALVRAVIRLAEETGPEYQRAAGVARDYVHGEPYSGYKGLETEQPGVGAGPGGKWNDWEMYAGLASATRGNLELLPPYIRPFFEGMFTGEAEFAGAGLAYPHHKAAEAEVFPPWKTYRGLWRTLEPFIRGYSQLRGGE